jgi:hypothetical protein
MQTIWMTANYLLGLAKQRIHALARNSDAGSLSLEWIVIAAVLFIAATAAGVVFSNAVSSESAKLP